MVTSSIARESLLSVCLKRISLLIAVLLISACSAFGLVFERLEWLVSWRFDAMFELDDAQIVLVREATTRTKSWMLNDGFPELVAGLKTTVQLWEEEKLEDSATLLSASLDQGIQRMMAQMGREFMPFAHTITDKNAQAFRRYIDENQDDWFEYAESDRSKWEKRREVFEDWFDDLERWQINALRKSFVLYPNERAIREANSAAWVEKFLSAALNDDSDALQAWMSDLSVWWTEDYRSLNEFNREQVRAALTWLLPQLDREQKRAAGKKVQNWIEDLEGLYLPDA